MKAWAKVITRPLRRQRRDDLAARILNVSDEVDCLINRDRFYDSYEIARLFAVRHDVVRTRQIAMPPLNSDDRYRGDHLIEALHVQRERKAKLRAETEQIGAEIAAEAAQATPESEPVTPVGNVAPPEAETDITGEAPVPSLTAETLAAAPSRRRGAGHPSSG
jgi:hypothetical protein